MIPLPRSNPLLLGHGDTESLLLESFASGRLPHGMIFWRRERDRQSDAGLSVCTLSSVARVASGKQP